MGHEHDRLSRCNLVLHIAACLLLWLLLGKLSIPGGFLAAVLYAVHPVNVESVAWIEQRKDTLSTLFFLLAILGYIQSDFRSSPPRGRMYRPGAGRWYWLALVSFALAMFSKGSVATLPLVLLLIAWWQHRRLTSRDLWRSAPFFVVSAILTPVVIWFVGHRRKWACATSLCWSAACKPAPWCGSISQKRSRRSS